MKLIFRILIILAAAGIIAATGFAAAQFSGLNQANTTGFPENGEGHPYRGSEMQGLSGQLPDGERPEGRHAFESNGASIAGLRLAGLAKNLGVIAIIVMASELMAKRIALLWTKKQVNPTNTPISSL